MARWSGFEGWANAMGHEIGPGVTVRSQNGGLFSVMIPCTVCQDTKEWIIPKKYPPAHARHKLELMGWRTGKKVTCPGCVKVRPKAHAASPMLNPVPQPVAAPPPKAPELVPPAPPVAVQLHAAAAGEKLKGLSSIGKLLAGTSEREMATAAATPVDAATSILIAVAESKGLTREEAAKRVHVLKRELEPKEPSPGERAAAAAIKAPKPAKEPPKRRGRPPKDPDAPPKPRGRPRKTPVAAVTTTPAPVLQENPVTTTAVPAKQEASPGAKAARRAALGLLEDHFTLDPLQPTKGRYAKGWSDQKVADTSRANLEQVKQLRAEFFGELLEPQEMEEFRYKQLELEEELKAVQARFADELKAVGAKITALQSEFMTVAKRQGWAV